MVHTRKCQKGKNSKLLSLKNETRRVTRKRAVPLLFQTPSQPQALWHEHDKLYQDPGRGTQQRSAHLPLCKDHLPLLLKIQIPIPATESLNLNLQGRGLRARAPKESHDPACLGHAAHSGLTDC